jgi:hypothetical protein
MRQIVRHQRLAPAAHAAMRAVIPFLCLLLCACNSSVRQQEITDSAGSNRLALINKRIWLLRDIGTGRKSYDFHALVWRSNIEGRWRDKAIISKDAFQGGSLRKRWVIELNSLNATNGTAIIKVAEGDVPEGSTSIRYVYSWREWSLLTNGEVRFLRTCADPFEKY